MAVTVTPIAPTLSPTLEHVDTTTVVIGRGRGVTRELDMTIVPEEHADLMYLVEEGVMFPYKICKLYNEWVFRHHYRLDFIAGELHKVLRASAIIFDTFDALERDVLDALSSMYLQIYAIDPPHLFQIPQNISNSVRSNLWKEEPQCHEWLNSQHPYSVIYVNFGSITVLTPQQLVEFAWGLANSKKNFLWIIRPDLVWARSFITGWCPQEQVLNHPSVSGLFDALWVELDG
ncbi:hypothetical protein LguiA_027199 [Lonicera macranthoides]